ncbi:hypothetical protein M9978_16435 [Sphingomonas sp. MG17]|uniref:Uncharacterized protein n=1 Tax=Sphingomonas tagetis TaxID=2949092 RepID=A0A9X2HMH9_9SPHN|nr:hypothetical protein [Sphingomonas tagetis]MCP3732014.1 hypothetical protein [Sphingomonas tagetis]
MLKKIVLHSSAVDSTGKFHDAGAELDVISEGSKAGAVVASVAQDLIGQSRALSMTQAVAAKPKAPAKPTRKAKPKAKKPAPPVPAPAPAVEPAPVTPVSEPADD